MPDTHGNWAATLTTHKPLLPPSPVISAVPLDKEAWRPTVLFNISAHCHTPQPEGLNELASIFHLSVTKSHLPA